MCLSFHRKQNHDKKKKIGIKLHRRSVHPFKNPYRKAPLGCVRGNLGYYAVSNPETMHVLEGGKIKRTIQCLMKKMRLKKHSKWKQIFTIIR